MKKISSVAVALAAGFALAVGSGGYAFAEDEPPIETPIEVVTEEAPAPEVSAAEPVADVEADIEMFAVGKPGGNKPPAKLSICHSGSGKNWTHVAPDAHGYNGHKNHDADVYGLSEADCLAKNPVTEWHTWVLSEVFVSPPTQGTDVAWPQTYLGAGKLVSETCGTWTQQDKYTGTRAEIDAVLADGLLTQEPGGYEDRDIVQEWKFAYSGDCPIEEPEPVVCTLDGEWFSESDDAAPTLTIDGLRFDGGTGKAVGIGHAINGDFSTWGGATYSATGDTGQLYYRLVIDSSADGGWGYQSLTATSGQPVTLDSLAYSNKVGESKTFAEWQALYPNAVSTFEFLHLDSATPEGKSAVVSAFESGCGSASWGIELPKALTGTEETVGDPVCVEPLNGSATVATWGRDWVQAFVPNADRTAYVAGDKSFGEPYLIGELLVESEACTPEVPPTEEPPVEEPPTETPVPAVPTGSKLPVTGAEDVVLWGVIGLVALGGGGFLIANHRRKRSQ